MNKFWFVVISLVLFAIGILTLFNSVSWGHAAANSYLLAQGGGMDTTQFMIILQAYVDTYRWLGSILALLGGLGCVKIIELR